MLSKEQLEDLYIKQELGTHKIAELEGCRHTTISKLLRLYNIPIHSKSWRPSGYKKPPMSEKQKEYLSKIHTGMKLSPHAKEIAINNLRGTWVKGEKNRGWKGGRYISGGYVFIKKEDHPEANIGGYIREHRFIMEQHIGRYLKPEEQVHHINRITTDNRIENLQLTKDYQEHMIIEWSNPELRKWQSDRVKELRKKRFWSSKKV